MKRGGKGEKRGVSEENEKKSWSERSRDGEKERMIE